MRGRTVGIGVVVSAGADPHGAGSTVADTVSALEANTDLGTRVRLVLLPDGMLPGTADDPGFASYPSWATVDPRGSAACLNRLARRSEADVVVLLEAGVLVGPGWLTYLLEALDRPVCGIAGPSTNLASGRQRIRTAAAGDSVSIARAAAQARSRYGDAVREVGPDGLEPFCVAVRREVLAAAGPADEGFGVGPYWERDLLRRAAATGWRAVWVGAAYAYRTRGDDPAAHPQAEANMRRLAVAAAEPVGAVPPSVEAPPERPAERATVQPSSLVGQTPPVRTWTPASRTPSVRTRPPLPVTTVVGPEPASPEPASPEPLDPAPTSPDPVGPALIRTAPPGSTRFPLVSAIMPTRGRPDFARQAARYFLAQDHPNTELVIVEDGIRELATTLPDDPRIRLVHSDLPRSIGALRNLACHHTRGEIVIQWDDDDWHGPSRISRQIEPIVADRADVTALRDALFFELPSWSFWRWTSELHRRSFVRDVHGGTLAYRRRIWEQAVRYPDRSLAEDAAFVDQAVRRGARLVALPADGVFVYLRHGTNSWQLGTDRSGWIAESEPETLAADRDFYADRSPAAPRRAMRPERPLVSCIMPTMDRRPFVARALTYFLRQTYPNAELVVLDDGRDPVADVIDAVAGSNDRVVYQRLTRREVLGTKRNLACELARGDVIAHWDDDDWQSPDRLRIQVERMAETGMEVSGARSLRFYDPRRRGAWRYTWPHPGRTWAAGPTLCFTRDLWRRNPFPAVATGEDSRFVWNPAVTGIADVSAADGVIAIIHDHNTVHKAVTGPNWRSEPVAEVEALLGPDLPGLQRPEWSSAVVLAK